MNDQTPTRRFSISRSIKLIIMLLLTWVLTLGCSALCETRSVYGPQPCDSDEFCVKEFGEGWYCDKDHAYDIGCGEKANWPLCKTK